LFEGYFRDEEKLRESRIEPDIQDPVPRCLFHVPSHRNQILNLPITRKMRARDWRVSLAQPQMEEFAYFF
jgi:hypothetical protein